VPKERKEEERGGSRCKEMMLWHNKNNRQRDVNRQHNNYVKVLSANFGIVYSIHHKRKD
jgi:hypothetical protein